MIMNKRVIGGFVIGVVAVIAMVFGVVYFVGDVGVQRYVAGDFAQNQVAQNDEVGLKGFEIDKKETEEFIVKELEGKNMDGGESAQFAQIKELGVGDEVAQKVESDSVAKIVFGGDVMLDRYMKVLGRGGVANFLDDVVQVFDGYDAVVLNFEGVVGERASISVGQPQSSRAHFKFTFAPKTVREFIAQISSPLIINDGNNHSLDFGYDGFGASRAWYEVERLEFFGDVRRGGASTGKQVLRKTLGGREISFISYNEFLGSPIAQILGLIENEVFVGRDVIVYTHWGTEYLRKLPVREQVVARQFVDAGARLVIGVHPHVIQPMETYKGAVIFYSLGNFIFDQFFSQDVRERLVAGCELTDKETKCKLTFLTQLKANGLTFTPTPRRDTLRKWFAQNSEIPDNLRKGIDGDGRFVVLRK